jgi:hypothetical protein
MCVGVASRGTENALETSKLKEEMALASEMEEEVVIGTGSSPGAYSGDVVGCGKTNSA